MLYGSPKNPTTSRKAAWLVHFPALCVESSLTSDLNFQRTAEHMCQGRYLRLSYVLLKVVSGLLLILEAPKWNSCSSNAKLHADLLACLYKKGHPRFDILIHHITYVFWVSFVLEFNELKAVRFSFIHFTLLLIYSTLRLRSPSKLSLFIVCISNKVPAHWQLLKFWIVCILDVQKAGTIWQFHLLKHVNDFVDTVRSMNFHNTFFFFFLTFLSVYDVGKGHQSKRPGL